jgi:hypothetical protein
VRGAAFARHWYMSWVHVGDRLRGPTGFVPRIPAPPLTDNRAPPPQLALRHCVRYLTPAHVRLDTALFFSFGRANVGSMDPSRSGAVGAATGGGSRAGPPGPALTAIRRKRPRHRRASAHPVGLPIVSFLRPKTPLLCSAPPVPSLTSPHLGYAPRLHLLFPSYCFPRRISVSRARVSGGLRLSRAVLVCLLFSWIYGSWEPSTTSTDRICLVFSFYQPWENIFLVHGDRSWDLYRTKN